MRLPLARLATFPCWFFFSLALPVHAQPLAQLPLDEQPCFPLKTVILDSGTDPLPTHLEDALSLASKDTTDSPIGQCVGAQGIQLLIDRVQNALIEKGFITSRVLAAPQNLQTGTLTLNVFMGKIHEIRWTDPPAGKLRRAHAWNTLPTGQGDVLNLRDIEQALENFKRVPTAEADIQIAPADEAGHSDLIISHSQPRFLRLNLTLDDSGTPNTGKQQASLTLSYDNWLTLSDLFYLTVSQDTGEGKLPGSRGTKSKTVYYAIPWGYQLLSLTHSQSSYFQSVAGANDDVVYAGNSENAEIKLSRVLHRDSVGKTTGSIKAFSRQSFSYIDQGELVDQHQAIGGWVWEIGHQRSVGSLHLDAHLSYKKGTGDFGAQPAYQEAFDEGTSRMRIWNADTTLTLPFTLEPVPFEYSFNWRYQLNKTRLLPQDLFSIGGRHTVRGFDGNSVLNGDRGWLVRNEISTDVGHAHRLYIGIDKGVVNGPAAEFLPGKTLVGAVVGVRVNQPTFSYDLFWGGPLQSPQRFKTSQRTGGFQLSFQF